MFPASCSILKPTGDHSLKTSSRSTATPSSEAVNTSLFASGTFAPRCCIKFFLAELRNWGWLLSRSGWRLRPFSPISSESCFLRLLCSMSSFESGTQSQIVLRSRNGYDLQFSALGTAVIAEQGDPLLTIQQQFCLSCFCNRRKSRAAVYFEPFAASQKRVQNLPLPFLPFAK